MTVLTNDGRAAEFFDFSTNQGHNAVYKKACKSQPNGAYQELTYKMSCVPLTNSNQSSLDVFVTKHPRCFSSTCTGADQDELLQEFVIQTTESRNQASKGGDGWKCANATFLDVIPSGCLFETNTLNDKKDIVLAGNDKSANPTVKQKKFLFFTLGDGFEATFPASSTDDGASYATACAIGGGNLTIVSTTVTCNNAVTGDAKAPSRTRGSSKNSEKIFHVRNFPTCLRASCASEDENRNVVIASQFQNKMFGLEHVTSSMKCSVSGDMTFGHSTEKSFL